MLRAGLKNILRAELRNMLRAGFVNIKGRAMGRAQAGVHWGPSSEIHWGPSSETYWGPSSGNILRARQGRGPNGNALGLNLVGPKNVLAAELKRECIESRAQKHIGGRAQQWIKSGAQTEMYWEPSSGIHRGRVVGTLTKADQSRLEPD